MLLFREGDAYSEADGRRKRAAAACSRDHEPGRDHRSRGRGRGRSHGGDPRSVESADRRRRGPVGQSRDLRLSDSGGESCGLGQGAQHRIRLGCRARHLESTATSTRTSSAPAGPPNSVYQNRTDGFFKRIRVERPFFSLDTPRGWGDVVGIGGDHRTPLLGQRVRGSRAAQIESSCGRWYGLLAGRRPAESTRRLTVRLGRSDRRSTTTGSGSRPENPTPPATPR